MKFGDDNNLGILRTKFAALDKNNHSFTTHVHAPRERRAKLNIILNQLKGGNHVQNRKLQTWLTEDEYAQLISGWEEQKELRNDIEDKPSEVAEYEALLKRAIFLENRADSYSSQGKKGAATKLSNDAQAQYERALEYLHDNITSYPSLEVWFDRALDFSAEGTPSLTASAMPRAVTTRSMDKNGDGLMIGKMSKLEVKIDVVERALANL